VPDERLTGGTRLAGLPVRPAARAASSAAAPSTTWTTGSGMSPPVPVAASLP